MGWGEMDYDGDGSTSWCWRVLDLTASCSLPPNDRVMCNTLTALAAWQCASHIHILYMHIWHLSDLDKIAKVCHLPQDVDELARTDEPDTLRCKWRHPSPLLFHFCCTVAHTDSACKISAYN